jgi:hypothetical protein
MKRPPKWEEESLIIQFTGSGGMEQVLCGEFEDLCRVGGGELDVLYGGIE